MIIPINKDNIPYRFEIELAGDVFIFEIHYNAEYDFFTVDLYRDEEVLAYGEKLVYGSPLFGAYADGRFPQVTITPRDKAENETKVTYQNLEETVFLFVGETDEELHEKG